MPETVCHVVTSQGVRLASHEGTTRERDGAVQVLVRPNGATRRRWVDARLLHHEQKAARIAYRHALTRSYRGRVSLVDAAIHNANEGL